MTIEVFVQLTLNLFRSTVALALEVMPEEILKHVCRPHVVVQEARCLWLIFLAMLHGLERLHHSRHLVDSPLYVFHLEHF